MYGRRLPLINWFRFDDRPLSLKGTRTVLLTSKIYLITFEEQEILLRTTILRAFFNQKPQQTNPISTSGNARGTAVHAGLSLPGKQHYQRGSLCFKHLNHE